MARFATVATFGRVPRGLQSDVWKILAYVAGTLALGAAMAPWLYQLGKGFSEVALEKQATGWVAKLAGAADRADFPKYFDRSLMLSALLLLFPLGGWLRLGRPVGRFRDTPWSLRLPDSLVQMEVGQPLRRNPQGAWQCLTGFLIAAGLLMLSGWVVLQAGCFVWRDAAVSTQGVINRVPEAIDLGKAVRKVMPTAVVVSFVEEILFRGILLGIFLRAMRPAPAIALLSFLFAFAHFLEPPAQAVMIDPESSRAGFALLGQIFSRFSEPLNMVSRFANLAAVGVVLAYARYRTASLWLPIGLHVGWVFGMGLFKASTWPVATLPEAARWLVGMSLMEGLLPLSVIILTGGLVHVMTRRPEAVADFRS